MVHFLAFHYNGSCLTSDMLYSFIVVDLTVKIPGLFRFNRGRDGGREKGERDNGGGVETERKRQTGRKRERGGERER